MKGKDLLEDGDLIVDGYDDCIIGIAQVIIEDKVVRKVIYHVESMVDQLAKEMKDDYPQGVSIDFKVEALDYLEFNTFTSYVGEQTPIFMDDNIGKEEEEEPTTMEKIKDIVH
jgi:hypothetical protein